MLSLGLSAKDDAIYERTLRSSHSIKITVQILDRNGNYVDDLSDRFIDGQVDVDYNATPSRKLAMTLYDPTHDLHLDSNSPSDGALTRDRMIKVIKSVYCKLTAGWTWVDCPVFCGPIVDVTRSFPTLALQATGKEYDLMGIAWKAETFKKGEMRLDVVREIAADRGEKKFNLPENWNDKLTDDFSLGKKSIAWDALKQLAKADTDTQVFYDARGYLTVRTNPLSQVSYIFSTGNGGNITDYPEIGYDTEGVKNTVWVTGATPKGKGKKPLEYTAYLPASHPYSKETLAINGKPNYLVQEVTDDKLNSLAKVKARAESVLNSVSLQGIDATFSAIPNPRLEPGDICTLITDEYSFTFRLLQFSVPLLHGNSMSVGANRKVAIFKKKLGR